MQQVHGGGEVRKPSLPPSGKSPRGTQDSGTKLAVETQGARASTDLWPGKLGGGQRGQVLCVDTLPFY